MKKLSLALTLLLALLFTGCAAGAALPEGTPFVFNKEKGYHYSAVPYGGTVESLGEAIGQTMEKLGGAPVNPLFEYENYVAYTTCFGLLGKMDAQFTDEGLFSVTFGAEKKAGDTEKAYKDAVAMYEKAYGKPTETSENANGKSVTWVDEKTGTALHVQLTTTTADAPIFQIGAYERWRYEEARANQE